MVDNIFGCDICQEVCPLNHKRQKVTTCKKLLPPNGVGEFINLQKVLDMETQEDFLKLTAGTPLTRPKLEGLKRNAKIILRNQS